MWPNPHEAEDLVTFAEENFIFVHFVHFVETRQLTCNDGAIELLNFSQLTMTIWKIQIHRFDAKILKTQNFVWWTLPHFPLLCILEVFTKYFDFLCSSLTFCKRIELFSQKILNFFQDGNRSNVVLIPLLSFPYFIVNVFLDVLHIYLSKSLFMSFRSKLWNFQGHQDSF